MYRLGCCRWFRSRGVAAASPHKDHRRVTATCDHAWVMHHERAMLGAQAGATGGRVGKRRACGSSECSSARAGMLWCSSSGTMFLIGATCTMLLWTLQANSLRVSRGLTRSAAC